METLKIGIDEIIKLIPEKVSLHYVDYRDSFNECPDELQKAIRENDLQPLYGLIDDWLINDFSGIDYCLDDLKKDLIKNYDIEEYDAEEIIEENKEEIIDVLYSRDGSNVLKDLLKNTRDEVVFYDTGFEIEDGSWQWKPAELRLWRMRLKKHLGIRNSNHDKNIELMLLQAGYGGSLVIYFTASVDDLITKKDKPAIKFSNPHIAIIDIGNGSGDDTQLHGEDIILSFDRSNLFIDRTIKYNYTFEVCGMSRDWCNDTGFEFIDEVVPATQKSGLTAQIEQDNEFKKVFEQGKCSFGDMDITRHRHVVYINDFPCGNKCLDCGTFWID